MLRVGAIKLLMCQKWPIVACKYHIKKLFIPPQSWILCEKIMLTNKNCLLKLVLCNYVCHMQLKSSCIRQVAKDNFSSNTYIASCNHGFIGQQSTLKMRFVLNLGVSIMNRP
jgi:hypothetical protein